jgi:hypothetical protein
LGMPWKIPGFVVDFHPLSEVTERIRQKSDPNSEGKDGVNSGTCAPQLRG